MKTKKVLETENSSLKTENSSLIDELNDWKTKYETLSNQYQTLKSKCDLEKAKKNTDLRCNTCKKDFESFKDLKKHKSEHETQNEIFTCSLCERTFNEDWKMNAHMKMHKNYNCDQCGKNFKYLELLNKHIKISHENIKIYCHYFNNQKICPFDEKCIFLHQEAKICKYGMLCERMYCMFRHEFDVNSEHVNVLEDIQNDDMLIHENSVTEVIEKEIVDEEVSNIVDVDDIDDMEQETDIPNNTFLNPSQDDKLPSGKLLKCELCDFASARKICMNDHKETNHNWCSTCYSSFSSQDNLKKHIKKKHSEKARLTGLTL
jgi:hypothetical protein